jgi:hypothetical protein
MKNETFTVRANPVLFDSGKLDYVRFTADCKNGKHMEWRTDSTEIDKVLHMLESSGMRYKVLSDLRSGVRVDLPGVYKVGDLVGLGLQAAG